MGKEDKEKYAALKKAFSGGIGSKLGSAAPRKKKGGGGFYSEKWAPPHRNGEDNPDAEPIALLEGKYNIKAETEDGDEIEFQYPFWVCYDHYNASRGVKRRSCVCSAGLVATLDDAGRPLFETGDKECIPCYYIDEKGGGEYINRGRKVIFTGVVLKWFHVKKVENKTIFEACAGKRCKLCAEGVKKQFGRRVFWSMGPLWAEYIMQKHATLQKSCGCGGVLSYLGFSCPECTATIRDYEDETPDEAEVERLRDAPVKCPKCKERVMATPELECEECDEPTPVDLWSVVLKPLRIGDKYTPDLESWRPMKPKEKEAVANYKPIDFEKFMSPSTLKQQSEWYGLKNPFDGSDIDDDEGEEGADEWDD